jgi:hypothetical protein
MRILLLELKVQPDILPAIWILSEQRVSIAIGYERPGDDAEKDGGKLCFYFRLRRLRLHFCQAKVCPSLQIMPRSSCCSRPNCER